MKFELNPNNQVCSEVQRRLGEYIDNTLSGREVWDIERHLAACTECNMVLAQTTHTITLLQHAPLQDTGVDFMANLHSRLDTLGPVGGRRTIRDMAADLFMAIQTHLVLKPVRTLGMGVAALGAAALMVTVPAALHTRVPAPLAGEVISQENLDRHVAVTASNPFDDPVAAKLEAEASGPDIGSRSTTE